MENVDVGAHIHAMMRALAPNMVTMPVHPNFPQPFFRSFDEIAAIVEANRRRLLRLGALKNLPPVNPPEGLPESDVITPAIIDSTKIECTTLINNSVIENCVSAASDSINVHSTSNHKPEAICLENDNVIKIDSESIIENCITARSEPVGSLLTPELTKCHTAVPLANNITASDMPTCPPDSEHYYENTSIRKTLTDVGTVIESVVVGNVDSLLQPHNIPTMHSCIDNSENYASASSSILKTCVDIESELTTNEKSGSSNDDSLTVQLNNDSTTVSGNENCLIVSPVNESSDGINCQSTRAADNFNDKTILTLQPGIEPSVTDLAAELCHPGTIKTNVEISPQFSEPSEDIFTTASSHDGSLKCSQNLDGDLKSSKCPSVSNVSSIVSVKKSNPDDKYLPLNLPLIATLPRTMAESPLNGPLQATLFTALTENAHSSPQLSDWNKNDSCKAGILPVDEESADSFASAEDFSSVEALVKSCVTDTLLALNSPSIVGILEQKGADTSERSQATLVLPSTSDCQDNTSTNAQNDELNSKLISRIQNSPENVIESSRYELTDKCNAAEIASLELTNAAETTEYNHDAAQVNDVADHTECLNHVSVQPSTDPPAIPTGSSEIQLSVDVLKQIVTTEVLDDNQCLGRNLEQPANAVTSDHSGCDSSGNNNILDNAVNVGNNELSECDNSNGNGDYDDDMDSLETISMSSEASLDIKDVKPNLNPNTLQQSYPIVKQEKSDIVVNERNEEPDVDAAFECSDLDSFLASEMGEDKQPDHDSDHRPPTASHSTDHKKFSLDEHWIGKTQKTVTELHEAKTSKNVARKRTRPRELRNVARKRTKQNSSNDHTNIELEYGYDYLPFEGSKLRLTGTHMSFLKLTKLNLNIAASRRVGLVLYPNPCHPLPPVVQFHLRKVRSVTTMIDESWAHFAVSAIPGSARRRFILPVDCPIDAPMAPSDGDATASVKKYSALREGKKPSENTLLASVRKCRVVLNAMKLPKMAVYCLFHDRYWCELCHVHASTKPLCRPKPPRSVEKYHKMTFENLPDDLLPRALSLFTGKSVGSIGIKVSTMFNEKIGSVQVIERSKLFNSLKQDKFALWSDQKKVYITPNDINLKLVRIRRTSELRKHIFEVEHNIPEFMVIYKVGLLCWQLCKGLTFTDVSSNVVLSNGRKYWESTLHSPTDSLPFGRQAYGFNPHWVVLSRKQPFTKIVFQCKDYKLEIPKPKEHAKETFTEIPAHLRPKHITWRFGYYTSPKLYPFLLFGPYTSIGEHYITLYIVSKPIKMYSLKNPGEISKVNHSIVEHHVMKWIHDSFLNVSKHSETITGVWLTACASRLELKFKRETAKWTDGFAEAAPNFSAKTLKSCEGIATSRSLLKPKPTYLVIDSPNLKYYFHVSDGTDGTKFVNLPLLQDAPLSTGFHHFNEALKDAIYFFPPSLEIKWRLATSVPAGYTPITASLIDGKRLLCKNGIFSIKSLTEEMCQEFGFHLSDVRNAVDRRIAAVCRILQVAMDDDQQSIKVSEIIAKAISCINKLKSDSKWLLSQINCLRREARHKLSILREPSKPNSRRKQHLVHFSGTDGCTENDNWTVTIAPPRASSPSPASNPLQNVIEHEEPLSSYASEETVEETSEVKSQAVDTDFLQTKIFRTPAPGSGLHTSMQPTPVTFKTQPQPVKNKQLYNILSRNKTVPPSLCPEKPFQSTQDLTENPGITFTKYQVINGKLVLILDKKMLPIAPKSSELLQVGPNINQQKADQKFVTSCQLIPIKIAKSFNMSDMSCFPTHEPIATPETPKTPEKVPLKSNPSPTTSPESLKIVRTEHDYSCKSAETSPEDTRKRPSASNAPVIPVKRLRSVDDLPNSLESQNCDLARSDLYQICAADKLDISVIAQNSEDFPHIADVQSLPKPDDVVKATSSLQVVPECTAMITQNPDLGIQLTEPVPFDDLCRSASNSPAPIAGQSSQQSLGNKIRRRVKYTPRRCELNPDK